MQSMWSTGSRSSPWNQEWLWNGIVSGKYVWLSQQKSVVNNKQVLYLCRLNQQSVWIEEIYTWWTTATVGACSYREIQQIIGPKEVWHRGLRTLLWLHAFNTPYHQYCEVPEFVGFKRKWKRPDGQEPGLKCVSAYNTLSPRTHDK